MKKTLSIAAMEIIQKYIELPIKNKHVSCPYFNNKRMRVRGALRVMIGKGKPEEISEEAILAALREKIDINDLNDEQTKRFLVDHNLGIDCSGFIYHVLNAELKFQNKPCLKKRLKLNIKNPLRKLLTKFRHVENVGIRVLADEKNSKKIELGEIQPGDIIILLNTGMQKKFNHGMIVHQVDYTDGILVPKTIHYTQSFQWTTDGKYNHGIKQGQIQITDINKPLVSQTWTENQTTGERNETWQHANIAQSLEIRRLI